MAAQEEILRAFVEAMPDTGFVLSPEGRYVEVFGPVVGRVADWARRFKGRLIEEVWPAEKAASIRAILVETLESGASQKMEYWLNLDGQEYCFEGRVARMSDSQGQPLGVLWHAVEITERKRVEAALQARDGLLEGVANAKTTLLTVREMGEAMQRAIALLGRTLGVDRAFVFQHVGASEQAEAYYTLEHEWAAKRFERLSAIGVCRRLPVLPDLAEWHERLEQNGVVRAVMAKAPAAARMAFEPVGAVSMLLLPIWVDLDFWGFVGFADCTQARHWEYSEVTMLRVATGSIGAFIHNKRGEEHLRQAKVAADAANAAKSEFLAMMSHEIRTPMNAILGFTDLLAKGALNEQQAEYVDIIKRSGRSLLDIINDILDFSKIESRGVELQIEPFALERVILEPLELLLVKAREKHLKVDFDLVGDEAKIYRGDPARLRQVLINLVGNAVKFTDTGGIAVRAEVRPLPGERQCEVRFSVKDSGMGIAPEKIPQMFQPFSQVGGSKSREKGGTGLGLVICKRLVNKMGGEIWVESQLDKGSEFFFTVQLQVDLPTFEPAEGDLGGETFSEQYPLRILLAEDDTAARNDIVRLLKDFGYRVDLAVDGGDALDLLRANPYDAVLLDMRMPRVNGREVARQLRSGQLGESRKQTAIIAISSYTTPGDREDFDKLGINEYLPKPLGAVRLKQALARVHDMSSQR